MKSTRKALAAVCVLMFGLSPISAWASTSWFYGTILKVEFGADGGATLQTLLLIDNYKRGPELCLRPLVLQATDAVCLDMKVSTAKEALVAGRSFGYFNSGVVLPTGEAVGGKGRSTAHNVMMVSTAPVPLTPVALTAAECRLMVVTLDKPGELAAFSGKEIKRSPPVQLLLEVRDGRVVRGTALTLPLQGAFWHEADVTGLAVKDGALTGMAKVSYRGRDGKNVAASYELQGTADGAGAFKGTCADAAVAGKLTAIGLASHQPAGNARIWLWTQDERFGAPGGKGENWSALSCVFKDGKADSGYICFRKGYVNGTMGEAALNLDGGTLKGSFTAKDTGAAQGVKVEVAGQAIGGCFVTATLTVGEQKDAIRVYGFLLHPEAAPTMVPGSETSKH